MGSKPPNCYKCKHRGTIPGDAHSRCNHPEIPEGDTINEVFAILGSVGRGPGPAPVESRIKVKGDQYGIERGWFIWPYNFDPTWLLECNGFSKKERKHEKRI